jgi:acetyl-CoA carboxylase carboxyl transferase subunit beta
VSLHPIQPPHPWQLEWDAGLVAGDPLEFPGYGEARVRAGVASGTEAVRTGVAVAVGPGGSADYAVIEGRFDVLGGSMGAAAGEKVVRAYRRARELGLPVVILTSSGGARIQEGMVSLIQMARTAGAARHHAAAGLLSLALYRQPTTGGVYASYASLVDLRAGEPGATIGFAGPRAAETVTGRPLPEDSHTAESAFRAGLLDALVGPGDHAAWIEVSLGVRAAPLSLGRGRPLAPPAGGPSPGNAWAQVEWARSPHRPTGLDWAALLCDSWVELRGADPVVRAALATVEGRRLVVVANDRHAAGTGGGSGAGAGRPGPEGYRLAQRAIQLAGRIGLPVLSLVDTPGADPGPAAEAGGIAGEIARTLAAMAELPTASVAVCVGEGGSGGALALAHTDRLLLLEHAVFSVIGPEGAAAVLWRDPSRARDAAAVLRMTAPELASLGIIDGAVAEDVETVRRGVLDALDTATAGDRARRVDEATSRWLL